MRFLKKIKSFLTSKTLPGASSKPSLKYVNTPELLAEACRAISACPWAGVDTEGDSLHHYNEQLCLLQVTVKGGNFVIDPLVPLDLKGLAKILSEKFVIFHGADFDVRILKKATGCFNPRVMFDTMLAAQILGYERFGLADLTEKICGIRLSKTAQKADWSRRPLTPDLLEYASGDTKYLERIYLQMKKELQKLGRLEWHRQACEKLLNSLNDIQNNQPREEDPLRWQLRGSKDLSGRALTYLHGLWGWRESEAKRMDRPSFKVLNTDYLLDMARWADQNRGQDITEWKEAPRHLHRQYREKINAILKEADLLPEMVFTAPDKVGKARRLRSGEEDKFGRLKEERLRLSQEFRIQPSVLVTNSVLETIVRQQPRDLEEMRKIEGILPWQAEVLALRFVKILHPGAKA